MSDYTKLKDQIEAVLFMCNNKVDALHTVIKTDLG